MLPDPTPDIAAAAGIGGVPGAQPRVTYPQRSDAVSRVDFLIGRLSSEAPMHGRLTPYVK
ncbi:hypothetical protein MHPYR_430024 [uncultured Mycobacterium sp.]|uniref:Uncharacterized protein n=1 Tax=uncultured Mycobacterium sp. TaxID=171292 RepID=A0A1Y5PFE6_9MYCO|nr:hypothetical protein MHPYR_430024 [uncultured Mycobacterium sp.]